MSVFVNQLGYYERGEKRAILPFECRQFWLINEAGEICHEGETREFGYDKASGDQVTVADFTAFTTPGKYRVKAARAVAESDQKSVSVEYSPWFEIGPQVYDKLGHDLMKAYYYLRCGCDLTEEYAGPYVHKACHVGKTVLWEDHDAVIEATGGWHDAGDYGRYITAGACALAHLLYAWRMYPEAFEGKSYDIPESGNGVPDVLNECRYELEWFLKMQRADGGVYHKLTTARHAAFVMPEEDLKQLYALPVSSSATADHAAICAMAATTYRPYDAEFSARLEKAAKRSYGWLKAHPEFLGFRNPPGCGTGEYGEWDDGSNRFWAAAEMYSLTGEKSYHDDLKMFLHEKKFPLMALGYGEVGGFGILAYLLSKQGKSADLMARFFQEIVKDAAQRVRTSEECGYGVALAEWEYGWGSNMGVMRHGMSFAIADYFGLEEKVKEAAKTIGMPERFVWPGHPVEPYVQGPREKRGWSMRDHAAAELDYLMGCNALGISYVTGNGENAYRYPHLRPAHADGIEECMPGMVSGGPNRHRQDAKAKEVIPEGTPSMKSFADEYEAYSLNEITIYWNSPAVFTLAYLTSKEIH
ncbi:MAG: glycoside hydrolase family 9 protein [Lachnospiraceae bacterium]|nr:glycoside hydrolase family 9 protein [Lachnospiraceae bacterium]